MGERLEINPSQNMEIQSYQAMEDQKNSHNIRNAFAAGIIVVGGVVGFANRGGAEQTQPGSSHDAGIALNAHGLAKHKAHKPTLNNVSVVVERSSSSAKDVINGKITFLADEHTSGYKEVKPSSCVWEGTFWNSGTSANGKIEYFKDHNGEICRDAKSPTGWVKVAGGETGRDCGNIAKPFGPTPGPIAPGKVEILASLNTKVLVKAKATAKATAECVSPGGSASASAEASATAEESLNLKAFLNESTTQKDKTALELVGEADYKARASAHASADAKCTTKTPVTTTTIRTTPTTTTTISTPTTTTTLPTPTTTTTVKPNFNQVNIGIVNQGMEPVNENSQIVICETVSGGNPGDALTVSANVVDQNTGQPAGTITSPAYNSATGYWCETWNTPNSASTDDRITVNVLDTTEQSQGAPAGDYAASTYTDVAVTQPI